MKEKNKSYYDLFLDMGEVLKDAVKTTKETLKDFKLKDIEKQMKKIHDIESAGDEITHIVMERLNKDFITPLEREDIICLVTELDDVIDSVEDIIQKIYMYNIKKINTETIDFFHVIEKCSQELYKALKELPNFRKSKTIRESIIKVNALEESGDTLYLKAMHKLYQKPDSPIEVAAWSEIYTILEKCCDVCEDVADSIDRIIMKNT